MEFVGGIRYKTLKRRHRLLNTVRHLIERRCQDAYFVAPAHFGPRRKVSGGHARRRRGQNSQRAGDLTTDEPSCRRRQQHSDAPGEQYATDVVRCLAVLPGSRELQICHLPALTEHGDVLDWLQVRLPEWDGFGPSPREPGDGLTEELFELYDAWETLNMTQLEYLDQLQQLLTIQVELERILEIK